MSASRSISSNDTEDYRYAKVSVKKFAD